MGKYTKNQCYYYNQNQTIPNTLFDKTIHFLSKFAFETKTLSKNIKSDILYENEPPKATLSQFEKEGWAWAGNPTL